MSRGAAEESFAAPRLMRFATQAHGLQPWLHSYAAPRLKPRCESQRKRAPETQVGCKEGIEQSGFSLRLCGEFPLLRLCRDGFLSLDCGICRIIAPLLNIGGKKMNTIVKVVLACSMPFAIAAPVLAHHSAAAFNTQQEVKVTGAVTEYKFRNPHVYMIVQVKKADGSTTALEVEAGAASVLGPLGFNKDSVAVGDVVTISGNPARNSPDKLMLGKDLYKADGTYYPLNIASRSVYVGKDEI